MVDNCKRADELYAQVVRLRRALQEIANKTKMDAVAATSMREIARGAVRYDGG